MLLRFVCFIDQVQRKCSPIFRPYIFNPCCRGKTYIYRIKSLFISLVLKGFVLTLPSYLTHHSRSYLESHVELEVNGIVPSISSFFRRAGIALKFASVLGTRTHPSLNVKLGDEFSCVELPHFPRKGKWQTSPHVKVNGDPRGR